MRVGSLFTGGGGLDMAVHQLWPDAQTMWVAETDPGACRVLEARWSGVPNLGDLRAVDWTQVPQVDVLVGGYPCQPWSNAGKRKGFDDERDGWPWFRDAIGVLRPRLVLLENVAGHLAGGAPRTVGDLAALGYVGSARTLRASDVGAPHRRDRWFAVAWPADAECPRLEGSAGGELRGVVASEGGSEPADAERVGGQVSDQRGHAGIEQPVGDGTAGRAGLTMLPTPAVNDMGAGKTVEQWDSWTEDMRARHGNGNGHGKSLSIEAQRMLPTPNTKDGTPPHSAGAYFDGKAAGHGMANLRDVVAHEPDRWGEYAPAIARWEHLLGRPAPAPTDDKGRLSPAFVTWLMGWPEGWFDGTDLSRAQKLKVLGNGVVPAQAVAAYSLLLDRTGVAA